MKTRTSSLLAATIAMMALISVNASAQGPDGGRRNGSHNGGARVESRHDNGGSHNNGGPAINHSRGGNNGPAHNNSNYNRNNGPAHNNGSYSHNNGNYSHNNGPAHNNGNYGHNNGPAHNNGNYNRPAPNNHITPSVGHNPGPAHRDHYRPAPRPRDHYRPAPRPRDHYRRPIPPRYFNRSAAYYRRAHIFADCIAAAAANALLGAIVANIPPYYTEVLINGAIFYLADNILYRPVAIYGRPYFEVVSPYYY